MKILAISWFDPASVVLSHRDLMRAAGHDFRLAVVRAYTERQLQADWVAEKTMKMPVGNGYCCFAHAPQAFDAVSLREFAQQADVIQFQPGIGRGDGDWATKATLRPPHPMEEVDRVWDAFKLDSARYNRPKYVAFIHGSNATRKYLDTYRGWLVPFHIATSTLDYACDLDAAYLPPLVHPPIVDGAPLLARLRGDDEPLVIAHTPTDRTACSTEAFIKTAQESGVLYRLGEHLPHADVWTLKAQCNAGFDHLRGSFSTNTLENAALGLVPLFGLAAHYLRRGREEGILGWSGGAVLDLADLKDLSNVIQILNNDAALTRAAQESAQRWWRENFSAEPITKRLVRFYESL